MPPYRNMSQRINHSPLQPVGFGPWVPSFVHLTQSLTFKVKCINMLPVLWWTSIQQWIPPGVKYACRLGCYRGTLSVFCLFLLRPPHIRWSVLFLLWEGLGYLNRSFKDGATNQFCGSQQTSISKVSLEIMESMSVCLCLRPTSHAYGGRVGLISLFPQAC